MRRLLVSLFALVAVLATSCSSAESPAASVAGDDITSESVEDELEQIKGNDAYRTALEQSYGTSLAGSAKGTFDAAFVAQLLSLRIYYQLLEQELDRRGERVTSKDRSAAADVVDQQFESLGPDVLKRFSESQRARITDQQATVQVAQRAVAADLGEPEEFYEKRAELFSEACISHILVSNDDRSLKAAKAKAEELADELEGGADFATLARASSDDEGSAEDGGDLGCQTLSGYDTAFAKAALQVPLNEVSKPVATTFGYHLIRVSSRTTKPFSEIAEAVAARVEEEQSRSLDAFLVRVTCTKKIDIDIDPKYGRWDRGDCKKAGIGKIVPPKGTRSTTTTVPAPG